MKKEENFSKNLFTNIKNSDRFFVELTIALAALGLIFAFTSSTWLSQKYTGHFWFLWFKQFIAFIIGFILLVLFSRIKYKFWYKLTWFLYISMVLLMTVTLVIGKTSGGSTRWIDLGFIQFQPAEVAKLSILLLAARYLINFKPFEKRTLIYILFSMILIGLVFKQPDLGSAAILVLLLLQLFFVFGFPAHILLLSTTAIGLFGLFEIFKTSYQLARIEFWLNPYKDPQGKGYNLIQAKYAFGLGGLWGAGIGNSVQKKYGHLPVPHADFIFAIIAEEIGFIGVTAILILFAAWTLRGLYLINKIENKYGRILGSGIVFLIITQTIINLAVSVGLFPVTGVTLPFFSCGGTSLIVTLAMCGILFNIVSSEKKDVKA